MKILLLAEEAAGLRVLRSIASQNFDLAAVVTSAAERGSLSSIENLARQISCEVWRPEEVRDPQFADRLRELRIDLLLNVHSLFRLGDGVVRAPRIGAFNLHPGPLPQMAGLNAPSWAIYLHNPEHAVTVHWMEPGIDTGAIAYAERFALSDRDTGLSVSNTCVKLGVPLIEKLLATAAQDERAIPRLPQDLSQRRVFRRLQLPNDGRVDWTASARQIAAFVRAADYGPFRSPWPHPRTRAGDLQIGVVDAHAIDEIARAAPGTVLSSAAEGATVASAAGIVLIRRVEAAGRRLDAGDVLRTGQQLD